MVDIVSSWSTMAAFRAALELGTSSNLAPAGGKAGRMGGGHNLQAVSHSGVSL